MKPNAPIRTRRATKAQAQINLPGGAMQTVFAVNGMYNLPT